MQVQESYFIMDHLKWIKGHKANVLNAVQFTMFALRIMKETNFTDNYIFQCLQRNSFPIAVSPMSHVIVCFL